MSVVKSKRTQSKIEFEMTFFKAFRRMMDAGQMTENDIWLAYQSWRGTVIQDHNACYKTILSIDALYASLFPPHREPPKLTRSALVRQANREADTEDLKLLFHLKY